MWVRAVVIVAAALPRTAALAQNRHAHIRGGRRSLEAAADACPADDCCPAKLEPIPSSECPPPDSGDVARFSCDAPDLVVGNLCRSNAGECGTDKNLDNCEYPETKLKADIYRVIEARPVAPTAKPTSICPELVPLEKDSPDCPDELDIAPCDTPGLTGFCEGDGECGTSKKLDNCACAGCGKNGAPITGADIYRIVSGDAPTPRPTKKPSNPKPTTSPDDCPSLEALPKDSPDCPAELDIVPCDTPGLVAGDFCEGDGGADAVSLLSSGGRVGGARHAIDPVAFAQSAAPTKSSTTARARPAAKTARRSAAPTSTASPATTTLQSRTTTMTPRWTMMMPRRQMTTLQSRTMTPPRWTMMPRRTTTRSTTRRIPSQTTRSP